MKYICVCILFFSVNNCPQSIRSLTALWRNSLCQPMTDLCTYRNKCVTKTTFLTEIWFQLIRIDMNPPKWINLMVVLLCSKSSEICPSLTLPFGNFHFAIIIFLLKSERKLHLSNQRSWAALGRFQSNKYNQWIYRSWEHFPYKEINTTNINIASSLSLVTD